jgi:hypothetical protein
MALAVSLLERGIERGFFHADNPPALLLKMMIASHQVQLQDWLDGGASRGETEALVRRMQEHFRRAFVRDVHEGAVSAAGPRRAAGV